MGGELAVVQFSFSRLKGMQNEEGQDLGMRYIVEF